MKNIYCAIVSASNVDTTLLKNMMLDISKISIKVSSTTSLLEINKLKTIELDLIFIDIDTLQANSLELANNLHENIQIVFISNTPNNALIAFDYNATDFLLKPIEQLKFTKLIDKVLAIKTERLYRSTLQQSIVVKHKLKEEKITINKIKWIEAHGDYVKIITIDKNYIILSTMKSINEKLPLEKFLRIHKSYIVNMDMVKSYNHSHLEIDGKQIPLSRTRGLNLDKKLNFLD